MQCLFVGECLPERWKVGEGCQLVQLITVKTGREIPIAFSDTRGWYSAALSVPRGGMFADWYVAHPALAHLSFAESHRRVALATVRGPRPL